jgi:hypothetical protein
MTHATAKQHHSTPLLSCDEILKIARQDGEQAYRDLSGYRITLALQQDGWHVDFDLTKPLVAGGGPHYVINPADGVIMSKTYQQ